MFKIFLMQRVLDNRETIPRIGKKPSSARLRNRRINPRYDIDLKDLSLMNDQEIFLIRDLSEKGFATQVEKATFARLHVGEIYLGKIRYLSELYETKAQVRWKDKDFIGFELVNPDSAILEFMQRLLLPLEIGTSLQRIDTKIDEEYLWFCGPETNIYLWPDESGALTSWRIENKKKFIAWSGYEGLVTGDLKEKSSDSPVPFWEPVLQKNEEIDGNFKQFATDIVMAANLPNKEQIIHSLLG